MPTKRKEARGGTTEHRHGHGEALPYIRSWTGSSASLRVSLKADENRRRRDPDTLEPIQAKLREQDYLTVSNSQQLTDRTRVTLKWNCPVCRASGVPIRRPRRDPNERSCSLAICAAVIPWKN